MKTKVIVYRIGGTNRFQWNRVYPEKSVEETLSALRKQGYWAYAVDAKRSESIGLPETYAPNERPEEFTLKSDGFYYRNDMNAEVKEYYGGISFQQYIRG